MIFFLQNVCSVLGGHLPKDYVFAFHNVIARATRLLEGWEYSTLDEQIDTLNWLIFELDPEQFYPPHMEPKELDPGEQDATLPSFIRNHMNEIELDPEMRTSWPQYFGLLALGLVGEAGVRDSLFEMADLDEEMSQYVPITMGHYAIEAVEAVCIGETLRELEQKDGQNLNRVIRKELGEFKHIVVAEKQKRGAIHFHAAVVGYQNVRLIRNVWLSIVGDGNIDVQHRGGKKGVQWKRNRIAAYLSKYISKAFDLESFTGRHRYRCSQNIEIIMRVFYCHMRMEWRHH